MTSIASGLDRPVLVDLLVRRSIVTDVAFVLGGVAVTAFLAQLVVPMWPVPITGQTLAVLLVGASLGWARAALSMALYIVAGIAGIPVVAPSAGGGHVTGLALLATPSFGYILGFVLAAAAVGWLAERTWDRRVLKALIAFIIGEVAIYAIGLPWLVASTGANLEQTIAWGLAPFLIGDIIKAAIAAALLPATWAVLRRVRIKR